MFKTVSVSKAYRKDCESVSQELNKADISSLPYHAGLSDTDRMVVQDRWVRERRCKVRTLLSVS